MTEFETYHDCSTKVAESQDLHFLAGLEGLSGEAKARNERPRADIQNSLNVHRNEVGHQAK